MTCYVTRHAKHGTCFGCKAFLVLFEFWIGESRPFPSHLIVQWPEHQHRHVCPWSNFRPTLRRLTSCKTWWSQGGARCVLAASRGTRPMWSLCHEIGYYGFHFTPKPHRLSDNLQELFLGCSTQPFVLRCHYIRNARKDWPKTCGPHYLWMPLLSSVGLNGRVALWFACPIPWGVHRLLL